MKFYYFVRTNRRVEWFANKEAAWLFMELHCYFGSHERLVKTNAI